MGLVFSGLIAVNVYFFFFRGGTSVRDLMRTAEAAKAGASATIAPGLPERSAPRARAPGLDDEEGRASEGVVPAGRPLSLVLEEEGVDRDDAARAVDAVEASLGEKAEAQGPVPAGARWALRFDTDERLRALEVRISPTLAVIVERSGSGLRARREERSLKVRVVDVGGALSVSLHETLKRAGEAPGLADAVLAALGWDLALPADLAAGDQLRILVEKHFVGGKFHRYGRVLGLEYRPRAGGALRAFWFEPKDAGPGAYYTEHGERLERAFLRGPLKPARSAGLADRHHYVPVPHVEQGQPGLDYAAPLHTPVWATAPGKVVSVSTRGALHQVTLAHPSGYETRYVHLGRVVARLGQEVRQGQVIGFVGGGGKGPHLHYALTSDGEPVDVIKQRAPRAGALGPAHRVEFADVVGPRLSALAAIELRAPGRLLSRGGL